MKASLLWGEVTDKDLYFNLDFPKIDVFRWVCLSKYQVLLIRHIQIRRHEANFGVGRDERAELQFDEERHVTDKKAQFYISLYLG